MVKASTDADVALLHLPSSAPPHHNPNIAHRKVNLLDCHENEAAIVWEEMSGERRARRRIDEMQAEYTASRQMIYP